MENSTTTNHKYNFWHSLGKKYVQLQASQQDLHQASGSLQSQRWYDACDIALTEINADK